MTLRFLVATVQGHGVRDNDFMWATEGEPVYLAPAAGGLHDDPDHKCGCSRAFIGVHSGKSTTTARAADLDMSRKALIDAMFASQGLYTRKEVAAIVDELSAVIQHWPVGTVVERRGPDTLQVRMDPGEAAAWSAVHEQTALAEIERKRAEAEARTAELRAKYVPLLAGVAEGVEDGEGR